MHAKIAERQSFIIIENTFTITKMRSYEKFL